MTLFGTVPLLRLLGQRRPVNAKRGVIVRLRKPKDQFRLDVEVQQQVQQLLERIDELMQVFRLESFVAQPCEIAIDAVERAAVLAHFESMYSKRQRFGTVRFKVPKVGPPGIDSPCREQELTAILVRGDVPTVARYHRRECGDRSVAVPLIGEDRP